MGPILKYLVLLLVVGLVFWLLGARRRGARQPDATAKAAKPPTPPAALDMVSCAHCGLHLPLAEALQQGDRAYCCEAHRAGGPRVPDGS